MSMLEEVATYLDAQVTALTASTNLFAVEMPPEPPKCAALYEYDGEGEFDTLGTAAGSFGVYENVRLQVQVRGATYPEARTLADEIHGVLRTIVDADLSGTHYHRVSGQGTWMVLEIDSKARVRIKRDYVVVRET